MFEQHDPQNAIKLLDIKKRYNGRVVLDIPSFCFERGKRYALLGANGSGKTTLLRVLAGLLSADEGELLFAEKYTKKEIAYLPQNPYAFALSVEKSVLIGTEDRQIYNKQTALEALDRVGMREFANAREDQLSGGETQRVALARMMLQKRKLLLLDEPSSATDIAGTEQIEAALKAFCETSQCMMVFATHSPAQAIRLADEAIFMDGGRILEHGDAKTVIHSPSSESAKAFLRSWQL